jgi:hypothetical protein
MIEFFDNKTRKVGDDLKNTLDSSSEVEVASDIFSIYGYSALKSEWNRIKNLRFIFTDPLFIQTERKTRESRQFDIHYQDKKKSIGGSDFEINLRNEMKGRAIARDCKKWIEKKAVFKSVRDTGSIQPHLSVKNSENKYLYSGIKEFSSAGFGYEKDNSILHNILKTDEFGITKDYISKFAEIWNNDYLLKDVTQEVLAYIGNLYKENSPESIYYYTLYRVFNEFLEDVSEDELANDKTGFKNSVVWNKLFDFQKDAVLGIINKLEKFNGCILADSVGLGKTFTALGVIKYYQERNRSILVLCPKKLFENWDTYLNNYNDNPLLKDRLNYDIFFHTDLSRKTGKSNGKELSRINWGNYDLVVIDESHNFRNNDPRKDKVSRYQRLLDDIMKSGVKTKVLMLSATPVNNRFTDLKNQIALAFEGDTQSVHSGMDVTKSVDLILRNAQKTFNEWSEFPPEERTSRALLNRLNTNFDFFKLLDSVTIARSRKHIEKYYNTEKIGKFPNRLKPKNHHANITDIPDFMEMSELYRELSRLNMSIYSPFTYILESKKGLYSDLYDKNVAGEFFSRLSNREKGIATLMKVNLLKRLESSVDSFRLTLNKFIRSIELTIHKIEEFEKTGKSGAFEEFQLDEEEIEQAEDETWMEDEFSVGGNVKINLEDMNTSGWKNDLQYDLDIARLIYQEMIRVTPDKDSKLQDLKTFIREKIENPINPGNRKVLIFSAFADTVYYIYEHISEFAKTELNLEVARISGGDRNDSTIKIGSDFHKILSHFSPKSKGLDLGNNKEIDILIATDCISEGQNLQDCDMLINYDIHWNPVRIIQRFGRIDRIGSQNSDIQLVNFWPQVSLDDYIKLKSRVENRMFIVDATGTGEDNVLTNQSSDLSFRKEQLEKLQNEVVDLEEMGSGISITDLGLNDFRMDLVNFMKENPSIDSIPPGVHTVCRSNSQMGIESGVIFVMRNINNEVNIDNTNQLHPFYLVYIGMNGEIRSNHLEVKSILDILRSQCKGYPDPIPDVYESFNEETEDGKNMKKYSGLLETCVESILSVKSEKVVDSLFSEGGTSALLSSVKGLSDFELISFFVIL